MQNRTMLRPAWVWTEEGLRRDRCVVLHHNRIVEVAPAERYPNVPERPHSLLLPGFVNAHSHAFQRAFRGHVQWAPEGRGDFWTWREQMYATANRLDPDGVFAVSRLAFLEMVEAGFTAVGEFHYLHRTPDGQPYDDPDELARQVIRAAESVGLRIALLRVIYAAGGLNQPLGPLQQRFRTDSVDEALRSVEALGGAAGLAPHSVRAVPPSWWPAIARFSGVVHSHVSEQPAEIEACVAATGRTPLTLIEEAGVLSERFTAVHLTHPRGEELARLGASGGRIAVCPTTELDLGDGFLPLEARALPLCIGTDSHSRIDPFAEIRALEMHARGLAGRRLVMAQEGVRHGLAEALLRAGTLEGARALGFESGIRAGAPADLVWIDLDRTAAFGAPPLEATVFNGDPGWVEQVWVDGRPLLDGGRHPLRDEVMRGAAPYLQQ